MSEAKKIKLKRIAQLLFFKRHIYPGAKEWELEKYVGRNYRVYIEEFKRYIEPLGLTVKEVEVSSDDKVERYFVVVPIEPLPLSEVHTFNLSIVDLSVLAVSLTMILTSRNRRVSRKEVEEILKSKFREYEIKRSLSKLIRLGYLNEVEDDLTMGLRSILEIDLKRLTSSIISYSGEPSYEDSHGSE
ncbi:hypothetical protein DRN84_00735 [Candidatus Geothermarchaeota archaeon]|nr:MAG: hypothetical protein DRN84_00735 [Candidatus Geothermarchaeota archaeon]HEW94418.1 hypothetical protein [Thermoprotei archaeon]